MNCLFKYQGEDISWIVNQKYNFVFESAKSSLMSFDLPIHEIKSDFPYGGFLSLEGELILATFMGYSRIDSGISIWYLDLTLNLRNIKLTRILNL